MTRPLAPRPRPLSKRPRTADAALAGLVLAVVGLMIVPLPAWLLDLLLATNLTVSVAVLLVALYAGHALKVTTFPTLLLITTLVRLSLNVSSTRLILLHAYAGEVIQSFGRFVVHGNYVVGAVIFLILALIQFVVIAKGSERVAEVGARFTLDAMPGKQLAIDAELRAGSIDRREATRMRRELAREGHFYGAMDGAMKFVKGDVIASFFITIINIVGGLGVGIGQRGMEPLSALKRYGLLTIGDGLVTQIPALFLATAAGVLVTRVSGETSDRPLGEDLAVQIFGVPWALRMAGGFALVLSLVPGLPTIPFLCVGLLLLALSMLRARQLVKSPTRTSGADRAAPTGSGDSDRFVPTVSAWSLAVGPGLAAGMNDRVTGRARHAGLGTAVEAVRTTLFQQLGVPLPPCHPEVSDELGSRQIRVDVRELPVGDFTLDADVQPEALAEEVAERVLAILRPHAAELLGMAETRCLLDNLERVDPTTARQVIPKPVSLTLLADVLRRLVEEGVTIRDLRTILEALAPIAHAEQDPVTLSEHVRSHLSRTITLALTSGSGRVAVYQLDPSLEETIRDAISRTPAGSFLVLAPTAGREIVAAVRNLAARAATPPAQPRVLLTQPDIRRFVRQLVQHDLPGLQVVSHADLLPNTTIESLGRATLPPACEASPA